MKKFYSAYEAAMYAAKITNKWINETDNMMTAENLLGMCSVADENNMSIDQNDPYCYYVVDDNGSVGVTSDGGKMIIWFAKSTMAPSGYQKSAANGASTFCQNCGTKLDVGVSFCPGCGQKIERKPEKRFCTNCGHPITPGSAFCAECGTPAVPQQNTASPKTNTAQKARASKASGAHGSVGYSNVIDSPRFRKAVKKNKKTAKGCAVILIIAPIIIVPIYTHFSDSLDFAHGILYGLILSAAIFLISLLASLKEILSPSFDGVVEKKYTKNVDRRKNLDDSRHGEEWETHYFIVIRKDNGGKHKIEEKDSSTYSYLKEGDRVRYHGKMRLLFPYEKYDKSHDDYVICAFCRHRAPIADDDCPKCHNPLLK